MAVKKAMKRKYIRLSLYTDDKQDHWAVRKCCMKEK